MDFSSFMIILHILHHSLSYISYFVQAAVYGIGVCAEFGGAKFKSLVGGIAFIVFICDLS